MANKRFFVGILAMALVFGMALVSCDDNTPSGVDRALNGTWVRGSNEVTFSNGNYVLKDSGGQLVKGPYTTNNGSMTITITHVYGGNSKWGGLLQSTKWYTRTELKESAIGRFMTDGDLNEIFSSLTGSYSVSGNRLTMGTEVYTRK